MRPLTFKLEPNYEKQAEEIPERIREFFSSEDYFMQHQIDTYNANKDYHVVLNTYPTGTGKTKASLLHLLDNPKESALFIAPTNELISQHVRDIKDFVDKAKLKYHVIELNAKVLDQIMANTELPRRGELLYRLLSNPRHKDFASALKLEEKYLDSKIPFILVTNPDIFYYAITFNYNYHDKRNIFEAFFETFNYIVIDEFHYYNSKQLASFLFFMSLSLKFGHLNTGKRITILTATPLPEVIKYFDRLKEEGLDYTILASDNISSEDKNATKTLSPIKVTFYPIDNFSTFEAIKSHLEFIKQKIDNSDGAIISNSLVTINDTANFLKDNNLEDKISLITGIVKQSSRLPLILATPTVDIGYNFEKDNKARQNIDYLLFDFRYNDEFWQRLGRAGRVLGKTSQDQFSEVIAFVSPDEASNLAKYISQDETISRQKLKEILDNNEIFQKRADLTDYLNFYGLCEFAKPIEELKRIMSKEMEHVVTKDLFDTICNVFAGKTKNYYYSIRAFNDKLNLLDQVIQSKDPSKCNRKIFNDFLINNDQSNLIERIDESTFKAYIQSPDLLKSLDNYIKEEYFMIKGLHSFRESFQSLTAFVYDPLKLMSPDKQYFAYDLFHLIQNYNLTFFKSKQDFLKNHKEAKNMLVKDKDLFYCQLDSRNKEDNLSISFSLDMDITIEQFEDKYLNKLIAKNDIEFHLINNEKIGKYRVQMPPNLSQAREIFKENYIPCIIINAELLPICFKNKILPKDLEFNGMTGKYKIIMGTNAYLLAPKIDRIRNIFERKNKCYIC